MICMADVLRDMNRVGFISLTNPSRMEQEDFKHHRAAAPFAEVEEARRLHKKGVSQKEIAIRLERSGNTIHSWIYHNTRRTS